MVAELVEARAQSHTSVCSFALNLSALLLGSCSWTLWWWLLWCLLWWFATSVCIDAPQRKISNSVSIVIKRLMPL